jgi:hypothetical protein
MGQESHKRKALPEEYYEEVERAYPRRDHDADGRYYRILMYIELRTSDTLHKKPAA